MLWNMKCEAYFTLSRVIASKYVILLYKVERDVSFVCLSLGIQHHTDLGDPNWYKIPSVRGGLCRGLYRDYYSCY